MNIRENNFQTIKDEGKDMAQCTQRAQGHPPQWQMDEIVEQRDAQKQAAHDETLPPERRRIAAEFAALLDGWLSAWD